MWPPLSLTLRSRVSRPATPETPRTVGVSTAASRRRTRPARSAATPAPSLNWEKGRVRDVVPDQHSRFVKGGIWCSKNLPTEARIAPGLVLHLLRVAATRPAHR